MHQCCGALAFDLSGRKKEKVIKLNKNTFISQETQCMDKLVRLLVNAQHG